MHEQQHIEYFHSEDVADDCYNERARRRDACFSGGAGNPPTCSSCQCPWCKHSRGAGFQLPPDVTESRAGKSCVRTARGAGESPGRSPPAWLNKVGTANRLVKE